MLNILEYRGYRAKIEFDAEDELFVGTIMDIEDIITFHATSVQDLNSRFRRCVNHQLEQEILGEGE